MFVPKFMGAQVGDFKRFSFLDKIFVFSVLSLSTYQSGKFTYEETWFAVFALCFILGYLSCCYFTRRKKLVRVIFHLQRIGEYFSDFA